MKNQPLRLTPAAMHELVMKDDFSPASISPLSEHQKQKLRRFIRARMTHTNPREFKKLTVRLAMLSPDADVKQDTWEYHHTNVCTAIAGHVVEQGVMPTQAVLAARTGYSRQTITKHLKAYREHPSYIEQAESMRLMHTKVMEKMLSMALAGNIRAAKVFMDTVLKTESRRLSPIFSRPEWMPFVQNNFFRINGLFITEEKLSRLLPDQIAQLETILELKEEKEDVQMSKYADVQIRE